MTQLLPWTSAAREAIVHGEWPLWNRFSASGSPLLASQQTAIFHPFTLAGWLLLTPAKAMTFSAAMRLFTLLFFTFVFLRGIGIGDGAALFGAVAYAFCTFHVVWLLFPLGLATMMLPVALAGVQELARAPRAATFALLTAGLALSVLGGHPESTFWVWAATAAYALFAAWRSPRRVAQCAAAFALAAGLTAFWWLPTAALVPRLERTQLLHSPLNPPNHHLGREWLETLVAPNLLGTVQSGTYKPPAERRPLVLDDYGEIASGYAGIVTLALATIGAVASRRREKWFFAGVMLFAVLTLAEAPLWRDALRLVPVAGLTLHQRLRVFWNLGACGLAALALDAAPRRAAMRGATAAALLLVCAVYAAERPPSSIAWTTLAVSAAAALLFVARPSVRVATAVTLAELLFITFRYNPPSDPRRVFPLSPAIRAMQNSGAPHRIVALGWSLIPDTPGWFGLEDVKTTNPVQDPTYMRMMRGYLHVPYDSYDQVVGSTSEPFFDFLGIGHVYAPPGEQTADPKLRLVYRGADGAVYENTRVLPRYFCVSRYMADENMIAKSKWIADFRRDAIVGRMPPKEWAPSADRAVHIVRYTANATTLDVADGGPALLVSSDAYWPGWRARWNGSPIAVETVNAAFVGCFLPAGAGRLELRYRPREFDVGLGITAAAAVLVLLAGLRTAAVRSSPAHPLRS